MSLPFDPFRSPTFSAWWDEVDRLDRLCRCWDTGWQLELLWEEYLTGSTPRAALQAIDDAEAEAAFDAHELHRYVQWSY